MNLLIIGGLLIVGVAAIVGVVFLVLGEQRANQSRTLPMAVTTSLPAPTPLAAPATAPLLQERRVPSQPASTSVPYTPSRPLTSLPAAPGARELSPRLHDEGLNRSALNGQFHELAAELRTLHQEAADVERRLHHLTELVAQLQETTSDDFGVEEDATSHPAFDNASM